MAAAQQQLDEQLYLDQRCASRPGSGLLPECLARLDGRTEDDVRRRQGLPARRYFSRRGDRERSLREAVLPGRESNWEMVRQGKQALPGGRLVRDAPYRNLREPILPVSYVPFHPAGPSGELQPVRQGAFIVRTSSAEPAGAGIHAAPRSIAGAERIPRQQRRHSGGTDPRAQRPRAAAGRAGAILRRGRAPAGGDRPVRRARLRSAATAARDRHSHGDWRASRRHRATGDGWISFHGCWWERWRAWCSAWHRCDTSRRCSMA